MIIGYTDEIGKDYQHAIDNAKTLNQLRQVTKQFYPFAWDADETVARMDNKDFRRFLREKELEHKGKFHESHMDFTATILMPEPMLAFGIVASKFFVPDGCAIIRMFEMKLLFIENGKVIVSDKMKLK